MTPGSFPSGGHSTLRQRKKIFAMAGGGRLGLIIRGQGGRPNIPHFPEF